MSHWDRFLLFPKSQRKKVIEQHTENGFTPSRPSWGLGQSRWWPGNLLSSRLSLPSAEWGGRTPPAGPGSAEQPASVQGWDCAIRYYWAPSGRGPLPTQEVWGVA